MGALHVINVRKKGVTQVSAKIIDDLLLELQVRNWDLRERKSPEW